jgi:hypothetical protein
LAFHELLGEPASNATNNDCCYPTDCLTFHVTLPGECDLVIRDRRKFERYSEPENHGLSIHDGQFLQV